MSRTFPSLLILLTLVATAIAAPTARVADGKVVVAGLPSAKGLSVVVAEGTEAEIAARPAMAGEWVAADGQVVFTPKYPLRPGTRYRVIGGGEPLEVRAPKAPSPGPTVVTQVYPTATDLPENVLRFYVEFNHPMPRGDVYKYVALYSEAGKKDVQPFVELDAELWNADQTRLTLLIDPGRIKKEVKPRIDLGPVFERGKKYTLVVSGKWPTLDGTPLGADFRKPISATAPLADGIDPKAWTLSGPTDATAPLSVGFGRPLDHPILIRALSVIRPDGKPVTGKAEAADNDRGWTFRPVAPWAAGAYTLRVDTVLEDVCGNRIGRPFEVDLARPAPKEVKAEHVDLPFTVGR
jgi:hypothetical protein